jgi:hypothetical protein
MQNSFSDVNILAQKVPDIKPHQRSRQSETERSRSEKCNPQCSRCGSTNIKIGAGLRPREESRRCADCGEFLGYSPLERLKRLRKRGNLTESLDLLECCGIRSEEAQVFLLTEVGAIGGEG